jgi:hypothetical protein
VIVPTMDPDRRALVEPAESPARPAVRFDLNFPSGWQPDTLRPGSGRVSLSRPETLAMARFLTRLPGCAIVLGFTTPAPRGEPYSGALLPQSDREVFQKLTASLEIEGASAVVPWFELGTDGGSFLDFAYQARGVFPLAFALPPEDVLASGGFEAFVEQVGTRVQRCLSLLPHLEVAQEGLERLVSDTWQLDVRVQNVGVVPTTSALASQRGMVSVVALRLDGAKLVATARKPTSDADYTDASLFQVRAPLSGGTLAGGEGRWLRLLLEASSGDDVKVTAASRWAGDGSFEVTLP